MKIITLILGMTATNCYIVYDENTKEAMIIDPGDAGKRIMAEVEKNQLQVKYILNTHGHADHIGANKYVKEATGAELLIHAEDAEMLTEPSLNLSVYFGEPITGPAADRVLQEGETIKVGSLEFKVLHTPGHTKGGICLVCGDVVFSGDTLFQYSIGRTDFPGGSYQQLINSIKTKLMPLDDKIVVYSGHGPQTTIGAERRGNPFLG
ncbi:MAG: MBL fold metallo-hydrolase [Peptococcia bacterium]